MKPKPPPEVIEAALRRLDAGEPLRAVARALGVHHRSLARWRDARDAASTAAPSPSAPAQDSQGASLPPPPPAVAAPPSPDVVEGRVEASPSTAIEGGEAGSAAPDPGTAAPAPPIRIADDLYLELLDTPPRIYGLALAAKYKRAPITIPPLSAAQREALRPLVPLLRSILPESRATAILIAAAVYAGSLTERIATVSDLYRRHYGELPGRTQAGKEASDDADRTARQ